MSPKTEFERLESDISNVKRDYENRKLALVSLQMGRKDGDQEDEELIAFDELLKLSIVD